MIISAPSRPDSQFIATYGDALRATGPSNLGTMGNSGSKVRLNFHDSYRAYGALRAFNDVIDGVKLVVKVPSDFAMPRGIHAVEAVRDLLSSLPGVTSVGTKWAPVAGTKGFSVTAGTPAQASHLDALLRDTIFGRPVEVAVDGYSTQPV